MPTDQHQWAMTFDLRAPTGPNPVGRDRPARQVREGRLAIHGIRAFGAQRSSDHGLFVKKLRLVERL